MVRRRLEAIGFKNFAVVEGELPVYDAFVLCLLHLTLQCFVMKKKMRKKCAGDFMTLAYSRT